MIATVTADNGQHGIVISGKDLGALTSIIAGFEVLLDTLEETKTRNMNDTMMRQFRNACARFNVAIDIASAATDTGTNLN